MSYAPTFSAFPGGPAYAAHAPSAPGAAHHAPVYAAPPAAPVQTQTFYVRKTNVFALIGVLVAMVISFIFISGCIVELMILPDKIYSKHSGLNICPDTEPNRYSFFFFPSVREACYTKQKNHKDLIPLVSKFHAVNMMLHIFLAVMCMCIYLLRIKGGKKYDRALLKTLIAYFLLCLNAFYWSNFDSSTAFVCVFWSAIVLPYFCVAFRAAKDVTSEKARRWLPFYYETVTLVDKPVV